MARYDNSGAKVLRRLDTKGIPEEFDLPSSRYGFGVSWDQSRSSRAQVDIDLQCVVVNNAGVIVDCAYYNNLKAARGITHSGDETTGQIAGIDELVWVNLPKLPETIQILIFVVAAYSGGYLKDVDNGQLHILEDNQKREIAKFEMEKSAASVDVVAAMHRGYDGVWRLRIIDEPAQQGQHFMDILPLLSETVRLFLPSAPLRQKVAFAMEKGSVLDLPQEMGQILVGLGWDTDEGEVDLDVSAVVLDQHGNDVEAIFFGRLESEDGSIIHSGDNLTGEGEGDDEQINCNLAMVSPRIQQVYFSINIYSPGKTFINVAAPYCRIVDCATGSELCRYCLRDAGREGGLLIAKIAREAGDRWGFHALGLPCKGRTYKDSLPDIRRVCNMKTGSLMLRTQTMMNFGGGHQSAGFPAPSAPPPPGYGYSQPSPVSYPSPREPEVVKASCGKGDCTVQ